MMLEKQMLLIILRKYCFINAVSNNMNHTSNFSLSVKSSDVQNLSNVETFFFLESKVNQLFNLK